MENEIKVSLRDQSLYKLNHMICNQILKPQSNHHLNTSRKTGKNTFIFDNEHGQHLKTACFFSENIVEN